MEEHFYHVEPPRGWASVKDSIPAEKKVSIVCVTYERPLELKVLIGCMKVQTWQNFELLIYHDGPSERTRKVIFEYTDDPRIKYFETEERLNCFGHNMRGIGMQAATGDYIGLTNDDNYYAPVYLEAMLYQLQQHDTDVAYCNMIHSHLGWRPLQTRPVVGGIDAGGWVGKSNIIKATPWRDMGFCGDGTFVTDLVANGARFKKVEGYYFVHN